MKALVYSAIAQGFSTPFLMVIVMLITNNRQIMGRWKNRRPMNVLGWLTTVAMFSGTIGLIVPLLK
jgi:Mn2+/Fe2+ NRAMP family transporter